MHFKVLKNIIPQHKIDEIVQFYNESGDLREHKMGMDKLNRPWTFRVVRDLEPIISSYVSTETNIGDNIFKHTFPYYPHVDIDERYPCINFLIPLYIHNNLPQHFVIFDQYVKNKSPKTWTGNKTLTGKFEKNDIGNFIYNDDNVANVTDSDIDEQFYKDYLEQDYRDRELFKGCSGVAVEYTPGDAILWDSKHIHCTGKMVAEYKIGLSLRFLGTIN
jgi:hypothetical protein